MASEEQCRRALEAHARTLLAIPGVHGVGIGGSGPDRPAGDCVLRVYASPGASLEGVPRTVAAPDGLATVEVRVVRQDPPRLS